VHRLHRRLETRSGFAKRCAEQKRRGATKERCTIPKLRREFIVPDDLQAVHDHYHYSPGVLVGDTLCMAGQLGHDKGLNPIQEPQAQFTTAFENVGKILHAAGADFRHVVGLETYFTNFQEDFPLVLETKNRYFPTDGPHWTGWEVSSLVMALRLEVKCTAVLTN
jgi:enamine deaminase RidA (YjgF/YER057c/UK114 family)